jgi:hypothetical protein
LYALASLDDADVEFDFLGMELDHDDGILPGDHILIPYQKFCTFMENYVSAKCHGTVLDFKK